MEAVSILYDGRIHAYNVLFDMTIGEYLDAVRSAVSNNPYQRKRVSASKTVYSLLRHDLVQGCVIPPLVLALVNSQVGTQPLQKQQAASLVQQNVSDLMILDGVQRTFTLLDLEGDVAVSSGVRSKSIRVEVYIGLNRIGILYRMLTLNTGQTPMSLRHQIEMLYLDYANIGIGGVQFIKEVDEKHATTPGELNFKDTIDGFNSYLERNELPLERSDLLENIQSLENLSHENSQVDIFREYVLSWMAFVSSVDHVCGNAEVPAGSLSSDGNIWGKTATQVFRKAQVMAGFGAATGKLKDYQKINTLGDIQSLCSGLILSEGTPEEFLVGMNKAVGWINTNTKKIGNAQRMFFHFYFRDLFNPETDGYLKLDTSVSSALHKLQSQLL
jgi:hypothetical protein